MLIPRVLHQIWIGPESLPDSFARYQQTWLHHHPGWEMSFWTEENLPEGLRRAEVYERLRMPAERADILRLELLWRFGGVYVDIDFECLRSIEPLIHDARFFAADIETGRVNNALIGSVAGHPILDRALNELRPRSSYGYDKNAAGPLFLDRLLKDYPDVTVFDKELFYARPGEAREQAYAIHHRANTWKSAEAFRIDARKAQRREQKAKDDARRWRLRCEQAEAELAELRQTPRIRSRRWWPSRAGDTNGLKSRRKTAWNGRGTAVIAWVILALSLAALGGYDAVSRLVADHDNFGDAQYVLMGAAWLALAAWAGGLVLDRKNSR
jgi:hypothetical protein